ncbi:LLM class flavin-dependent oxidoreductase [Streptomyces sp. YIM 130001]|uniref:LLM class flavin-dependent oxidoreductase n=1 Tax=Streptomyces sp. YIM 130001 TaxID=2259644 RepID=UPI000E6509B7|nr:LLM class flavin-dependent oxidoreductase [Streptomyces sp. YIM 130001]
MNSVISRTRFSVLDRSRTRAGQETAAALRDTVRFAQQIEELGYHRFWVSEHHSVPGVAGSAPTVLAAAVAGATSTIRVGTGGVMLPNHRPLVVAEQFGVLASLFPGRIDMGLGRSVGFTGGIRRALGVDREGADAFADQLRTLLGFLTGTQTDFPQVHAHPAEGLGIPAYVLAMGEGATVAAEAGLPLVIGDLRSRTRMVEAVGRYRDAFKPSQWAAGPEVIISGNVAVAGTAAQARRLLVPEAWSMAYSRTHGVFPPLEPAEATESRTMTDKEREFFESGLRGQLHGTPDEVYARLEDLITATDAAEVLVTTSSYDRAALLDSYSRLARLAGLDGPRVARGQGA